MNERSTITKDGLTSAGIMGKLEDGRVRSAYDRAFAVMKTFRAGALSTANENGLPHVAIVYTLVEDDLSLYFSTQENGRKYRNILQRPDVSIAFFNEVDMECVQLTGKVEQVVNLEREQEILSELMAIRYGDSAWPIPPLQMYERGVTNELAIFKVTPTELTYCSFDTSDSGRYKPFFEKVI